MGGAGEQMVGSAAFRTPPAEPAAALRFLATADVGDPVSHSWTALPQMAEQCGQLSAGAAPGPPVELGLHIGDIAYNLDIVPRGDDSPGRHCHSTWPLAAIGCRSSEVHTVRDLHGTS